MTDTTLNAARRRLAGAGRKARASAEAARERLVEAGHEGADWASDRNDALRELMIHRPMASAGVSAAAAFVAGLVLGVLLERAVDATEERQWQKRLRAAKSHLPNWRDY